jgi:alkylation response protein AidB-like acyl-CoA dehydrogenase
MTVVRTPPDATIGIRGFLQDPPRLTNTFDADTVLAETLERLLPNEISRALRPEWRALGEEAAGSLESLARQAEAQPPRHVPYDAWGRRVDEVVVSPAWRELARAAARWGLAAIPYEGRLGAHARLHQFALLALYAPSSAVYTCHLAMTDGAARTLLEHDAALAAHAVPRLTSRDPERMWTSGQWMTERSGGSDVGATETEGRRDEQGGFRLFGAKWFTSAVTSEMALTLARPEGAGPGSAGLSLFYVELRDDEGRLQGIRIERLKDKLGTRALPTAELILDGAPATPVGDLGGGVRKITPLLNVTRLHNAVNACGTMARLLQLLRDYARRRVAFGGTLATKPLHRETLAQLHVEYEGALALTLECARLLGRQEAGSASAEEKAALRLLTPLVKLMTARQAVATASESLEGFGGAGYVEDTGLPVFLRDAQVLPIWEGTTNVLSLDVLRAVAREDALTSWLGLSRGRLSDLASSPLAAPVARLASSLDEVETWWRKAESKGPEFTEASARRFALVLAALAAAVPLVEQGAWGLATGRGDRSARAAERWVGERLPALPWAEDSAARLRGSRVLSGLEPSPEVGE